MSTYSSLSALLTMGLLAGLGLTSCNHSVTELVTADQQQALVDLGFELMFDEELSRPNGISCATCHDPQIGWGDGRPQGKGVQDHTLDTPTGSIPHDGNLAVAGARFKTILTGRNTPTIYNSHVFPNSFWDGRAGDLAHQANFPVGGFNEMNSDWGTDVIPIVEANSDYMAMYQAAFKTSNVTQNNLANAIGAYEETISVFDTPYDQYVAGDSSAMTAAEIAGMDLFFGKAACNLCHDAPLFTDLDFHNIGVPDFGQIPLAGGTDIGRGAGDDWTAAPVGPTTTTPSAADDYKFKTPQLRMVKVTGPYFHNGFGATIEETVEFMATGGGTDLSGSGTKSPEIIDRGLTVQELADLTAFVRDALMGTEIK
jgi:cytochrome c peroxidase